MNRTEADANKAFGRRVRAARSARKMTQAEVALAAGLSDGVAVSKIETGTHGIRLTTALSLADALEASLDFLTGREGFAAQDPEVNKRMEILKQIEELEARL